MGAGSEDLRLPLDGLGRPPPGSARAGSSGDPDSAVFDPVSDASMSAADLAAVFETLSPEARLVAMAFGVVHPHRASDGEMAQLLADAGFEHGGKASKPYQYLQPCKDALDAGLLREPFTHKIAAVSECAPWLAVEAFRQGKLERIEAAWREENAYSFWSNDRRAMTFRCNVVAGRWDDDEEFAECAEPGKWRWLAHPGAEGLLATLPESILSDVSSSVVGHVVATATAPDPILEACRKRVAEIPERVADEAFVRILQGRFRDAVAVFDRLAPELREAKPVRVGFAATRALIATLHGDDAEAIRLVYEAVEAEKAGTRRSSAFPASRAFALALLSLVRDHTPKNAAEVDRLTRIGRRVGADSVLLAAVSRAVAARDGDTPSMDDEWPRSMPVFARVVDGLACCWAGDFERFDAKRTHALHAFGMRAAAHGYAWLAAECFVILNRLDVCPTVRFRDETFEPSRAGAAIHERMGTTTLTSLIEKAPEWEYPLRKIEQLAYETSRKKPERKRRKAPGGPVRRLAWELHPSAYGFVHASAKEQRAFKSGKWSKGRAISLKALFAQAAGLDYLTERDRAVVATIVRGSRRSAYPSHYVPPKGLYALAGHPHVFDEDGVPVEVARREVELRIEERDGRLVANVRPHTDTAVSKNYDVVMAGDARCEVTRFTAEHRRLCGIVPPEGVALPAGEAGERLLGAVSDLASVVRVQGDLGANAATQLDADCEPWVRLEPSGTGLAVAVLVEPVAGSGVYFQPGTGGTTVFAQVNGDAVQARRALDVETEFLRALLRTCPMLAGLGPDRSMVLSEPDECLELVDQLGAAEVRCLWPKGRPFDVVSRADASSLRLSFKSAADWFVASGELAVDEERTLGLRRLLELVDRGRKTRFVELGGGEFVSLTAAFRRQLDDLGSLSAPSGKGRLRIHPMAALALRDFLDDTELEADEEWRTQRERLRDAQALEPDVPSTLQAELRPYQEEGFRWLARLGRWGVGACLADDMGLGKTVQTLAALLDRAPQGPALVVVPTSVVANWVDEARRFAPTLNVRVYVGPAASRAPRLEGLGPFDVVITTYGLMQIDARVLAEIEWSAAVLDEAQAIKNPSTKRARAARSLNAGFRVATTGTPVQNNLMDLHSLFGFLNPGLLGSTKRFRENFALPVERDGDPAARARLRRLIAPFVLRRLKANVLDDLPARTEVTLKVEMSPEEVALYEALRHRAMEDLDALADGETESGPGRLQVLAHLTRLRLACCNPRLVHPESAPPSSKLAIFADTLDELRQGNHKVLVFSQFVRHLKLIEEHLVESGVPYQYLDGATPAKARAERVAAFQAGDGDAFLISLKAGGVGLNLTAADYVIHMDPWWNPAAEDQASGRAHRIGQTRPVTVYRLVAKDTIEEQIVDLHRHKRDLADRILEGADAPARLSADELLKLLRDPAG